MTEKEPFHARSKYQRGSKSRVLGLLSSTHLVNDMFFNIIPPILPDIQKALSLGYLQAGLIFGFSRFAAVGFQPYLGHLSEKWGLRKMTMTVGLFLLGATLFSFSYATDYTWFAFSALLLGIGLSTYHPQGIATISDYFDYEKRGRAMGIHGGMGHIGLIAGPLLVALFVTTIGWRMGFRYASLITIPMAVILWKKLKIKEAKVSSQRFIGRVKWPVILLGLTGGLMHFGFWGIAAFITSYYVFRGVPLSLAALYLGLALALALPSQPVGGLLADRFGRKNILIIAMISIFPLIPLFLFSGVVASLFLLVLICFLFFICYPIYNIYATELGETNKGLSVGINFSFEMAFTAIAPILAGSLIDQFGFFTSFMAMALSFLVSGLLLLPLPQHSGKTSS